MNKKSVLTILTSLVFCLALMKIELPALDAFFLDWKQIILSGSPDQDFIQILDVTQMKVDQKKVGDGDIPAQKLLELLEKIRAKEPKAIFVTIAEAEIANDISLRELYLRLSEISRVYVSGTSLLFPEYAFSTKNDFVKRPSFIPTMLTKDTSIDQISRRLITFYDLKGKSENEDFKEIKNILGFGYSPDYFKYDFEYAGTKQIHMKHWPFYDFNRLYLKSIEDLDSIKADLKNKLVIVDTSGIYAFGSSYSIKRRLPWVSSEIEDGYVTSGSLVASYVNNVISGDYVKTPGKDVNGVWMFAGLSSILLTAVLLPVTHAFIFSLASLGLYVLASGWVFWVFSFNFDTGKVFLLGLVLQYFILSFRFARKIRFQDSESHLKERALIEERLNNRIVLKAAIAESTMRTMGMVSHDIRSPLTALNIANSILKGKIPTEIGDIIGQAIDRIEGISSDLLRGYKRKDLTSETRTVNLSSALGDLVQSYRVVDQSIDFKIEVDPDLLVDWPLSSMVRSFTNLISNSLEAAQQTQVLPRIQIKATKREEGTIIIYSDNGPGVPEAILPRLFGEGVTHGKKQGTGLGLYQVKSDLEKWGGQIRYQKSSEGALFEIFLPASLDGAAISLAKEIVLIEAEESGLEARLTSSAFKVSRCSNFAEARQFILNAPKPIALISDLTLLDQSDSIFDLISTFENRDIFQKILIVTSLTDSEPIKKMANKYGAIIVDRSGLMHLNFGKQ